MSITVIVIHVGWVFLATYVSRFLSRRLRTKDPYPGWRNVVIIAWTGLRGEISLAAPLALTVVVAIGQAFPHRNLIIELTFGVILATLVGQRLSLTPLVRILRLQASTNRGEDLQQARLEAAHAALVKVEELAQRDGVDRSFLAYLHAHYEQQVQCCLSPSNDTGLGLILEQGMTDQYIRTEVLQSERASVIILRDNWCIDD